MGYGKIWNHIRSNNLDECFVNPVTMNGIYKVRTEFKQLGITEKLAQLEQTEVPATKTVFQEEAEEVHISRVLYDSQQQTGSSRSHRTRARLLRRTPTLISYHHGKCSKNTSRGFVMIIGHIPNKINRELRASKATIIERGSSLMSCNCLGNLP